MNTILSSYIMLCEDSYFFAKKFPGREFTLSGSADKRRRNLYQKKVMPHDGMICL